MAIATSFILKKENLFGALKILLFAFQVNFQEPTLQKENNKCHL